MATYRLRPLDLVERFPEETHVVEFGVDIEPVTVPLRTELLERPRILVDDPHPCSGTGADHRVDGRSIRVFDEVLLAIAKDQVFGGRQRLGGAVRAQFSSRPKEVHSKRPRDKYRFRAVLGRSR